jgi:hypothetical protein
MILTTAAFLSALGFVTFLVGHLYGYQGIATIGAVLIVGLGGGVMVGGLEVESGQERVETANTTTDGERVDVNASKTNISSVSATDATVTAETTYEPIGTTSSFPLGVVLTLLGGVMTMRALEGGQLS